MAQTATKPKAAETAVKQSAKVVEQHSKKIADSAKELKHSSYAIEDSADRTTQLAADRTILAAERTYAAWVRTGLFALASGIGARALLTGLLPEWLIQADASMLIAFSDVLLRRRDLAPSQSGPAAARARRDANSPRGADRGERVPGAGFARRADRDLGQRLDPQNETRQGREALAPFRCCVHC